MRKGKLINGLTVITDHKWRNLLYGYELTPKERKDFDWMDDEELSSSAFFRYRGSVYAICDIMRATGDIAAIGYDGFNSDTYSSGIAVKLSNDGEQYQAATIIA